MNVEKFNALKAEGFNRIPVMREVLADLDTPLSAFLKLANCPYSYLFESVQGGEKWGRYSIIGLPCRQVIRITGHEVEVTDAGNIIFADTVVDPLAWIQQYQNDIRVAEVDGLPRFTGGLVGYFGYDTVRYIEPKLGESVKPDAIKAPDILLMLSEEVVVFDNLSGRLYLVVHADAEQTNALELAQQRLDQLHEQLQQPIPKPATHKPREVKEQDFVSGFTRDGFEKAVERIREYITEGDAMQVVLSQRLSVPYQAPPLDLYRALRSLNPSPYMFYLDLEDFYIVGSSPEILVRLEDGEVTVRPIAGTRRRGHTEEEDRALEAELLADPKELAEHLMLIDLGRNDTGRVAKVGSVRLTDKMVVERYSHVMHIVSNVEGRLKEGLDAMDVLRASFPAGTVWEPPRCARWKSSTNWSP